LCRIRSYDNIPFLEPSVSFLFFIIPSEKYIKNEMIIIFLAKDDAIFNIGLQLWSLLFKICHFYSLLLYAMYRYWIFVLSFFQIQNLYLLPKIIYKIFHLFLFISRQYLIWNHVRYCVRLCLWNQIFTKIFFFFVVLQHKLSYHECHDYYDS